jgi:hypothetical protein
VPADLQARRATRLQAAVLSSGDGVNLTDAQVDRARRGEELAERKIDDLLDRIGLSDSVLLGTENVSPADRKKLSGIINRLRGKKHAFTQCMRDLEKHHPEWSDDRRKRTCAVLKALAKPGSRPTRRSSAPRARAFCSMTPRPVWPTCSTLARTLSKINEEAT